MSRETPEQTIERIYNLMREPGTTYDPSVLSDLIGALAAARLEERSRCEAEMLRLRSDLSIAQGRFQGAVEAARLLGVGSPGLLERSTRSQPSKCRWCRQAPCECGIDDGP